MGNVRSPREAVSFVDVKLYDLSPAPKFDLN